MRSVPPHEDTVVPDPAEQALDQLLHATSASVVPGVFQSPTAPVASELNKERMLGTESARLQSRVLFVTSDPSVLVEGTLLRQHYTDLQDVFDEIHVVIVRMSGTASVEPVRIAPSVWVYTLTAHFLLQLPAKARQLAKEQLEFTSGFRPDLIVATEPFEAALAAYAIASQHQRPIQVHIETDDWLDRKKFIQADPGNRWRLRVMRYVLRRVLSVRVASDALKQAIVAQYSRLSDVALLPKFFNTRQLLSLPQTAVKDIYPQFAFTVMFVGELNASSTLFRAMDAARAILQTPTIGFVVIGDGPLLPQFRDRAKIFGIEKQVLFVGKPADYIEHMRSADVLLVTDTVTESDTVVITAAALGVPMIMAETPLRRDLFKDGTDCFLCQSDNTIAYTERLRTFINTGALRVQFATNSREVVRTRIEEDPHLYRVSYRDSIERMLVQLGEGAPAMSNKRSVASALPVGSDTAPRVSNEGQARL